MRMSRDIHSTLAPKIRAESESPGPRRSMNALAPASAPRIFSPSMLADVSTARTMSACRLFSLQRSWIRRMAGRAEAEAESKFLLWALEQEIDVESTGLAVLLGDPGPLDHADRVRGAEGPLRRIDRHDLGQLHGRVPQPGRLVRLDHQVLVQDRG